MNQIIGTTSQDTPLLQKTAVYNLTKWDARFILLSQEVAQWSKDPNKKVGAVLVSPDKRKFSFGYNGFPKGIQDSPELFLSKEEKNELMVHAELNCILNADETQGWTMYISEACCVKCATAIIQANVARIVMPLPKAESSWFNSQKQAVNWIEKAKTVTVTMF